MFFFTVYTLFYCLLLCFTVYTFLLHILLTELDLLDIYISYSSHNFEIIVKIIDNVLYNVEIVSAF